MARKIQFKRGLKKNLPTLSQGEMAFTTDEKSAYIGDGSQNVRLLDQKDKTELTTQLAEIPKKVNGKSPDSTGNIQIDIPQVDTSKLATKTDIQQLSLSFKESYDTLSTLQTAYPNGDNANHVVLTDKMIYTYKNEWVSTGIQAIGTGLVPKTVEAEHTNFLEKTINIFNKSKVKNGHSQNTTYMVSKIGETTVSTTSNATEGIKVEPNTIYRISKDTNPYNNNHVYHFNNDGLCVGYLTRTANGDGTYTVTTSANTVWIVLNMRPVVDYSDLMITKASEYPSSFIPYGFKSNQLVVEEGNLSKTLKDKVDNLDKVEVVDINVAVQKVYTIVGEDHDIFTYGMFDTNMKDDDYQAYTDYNQIKNKHLQRLTVNGGAYSSPAQLTIPFKVYRKDKPGLFKTLNIPFEWVSAPSNPSTEKNILFIGDSLVERKTFSREFIRKLVNGHSLSNYKMIGRLLDSTEPLNRYEGVGGYSWNNYVDNPSTLPTGYSNNYFWDSAKNDISIQKYLSTYCEGKTVDYMIINLGWNHKVNGAYSSDLITIADKCKKFLDTLHREYPNCKVVINGIHYSDIDVAYTGRLEYKEFGVKLNALYNSIANMDVYKSFVVFCDVASSFDARYGMSRASRPKSEWTNETETYVSDYVHPSDLGFKMHAYTVVRTFFKTVTM